MTRAVRLLAAALLALPLAPAAARGQFPAELQGRVLDAATGEPVASADVAVPATNRRTTTSATGGFLLRGLEAGPATVVVAMPGYATASLDVELADGRRESVTVRLAPRPVEVEGLVVRAPAAAPVGARTLDHTDLERSGARSLADALESMPGVVVSRGTGGAARVSIRGGAADEVLVLIDGAPANDPVTGVADVSRVDASSIERVTVVPGARSAEYGPRAATGVILVRTRGAGNGAEAAASLGSLGERAASLGVGGTAGSWRLGARAGYRASVQSFDFELPDAIGGGTARWTNAERASASAALTASRATRAGELGVTLTADRTERGLPGTFYGPTPLADERDGRVAASARWTRAGDDVAIRVVGYGTLERSRFRDPAPAVGLPYDDTMRAAQAGGRAELRGDGGALGADGWRLTLDARGDRTDASSLTRAVERLYAGVGAGATWTLLRAPELRLAPSFRLDRADGRAFLTHDVALSAAAGPVRAHLAHRSSVSPPTLGDRFFREGVAVEPNRSLGPERVPSEWELGAELDLRPAGLPTSVGATAFRADVRDMIVWTPDYRFVWSPRNRDVKRAGLDAWASVEAVPGVTLRGEWGWHRVTYDWPGEADTVQLVYRPRHVGRLALDAALDRWTGSLEARYTGVRYPVPARANALPAFWEIDAGIGRSWSAGASELVTRIDVDRLLDNRDAFVFGYPEPGRRLRFELRVRPLDTRPEERQ